MPELADDQIKELIGSLSEYSESSVQAAIEAAKDPDVANQFATHIDQNLADLTLVDFTEIGLCIAISEARAINAIPAVLRLAVSDESDTEIYSDAAIYALQRMGMPAFEAAMRFIDQPLEDVTQRIGAYSILEAAVDEEDSNIRPIADFCLRQMEIEGPAWRDEEDNAALFCCEALVIFHDQRVRPWLVEFSDDSEIADLLKALDAGSTPEPESDWGEDWPSACSAWAEQVTGEFDDFSDLDEDDVEIIDPDITARVQQLGEMVEEFKSGLTAEELTALKIEPDDIIQLYEVGLKEFGKTFDFTDEGQLHDLLYVVLISKFTAGSEYFAQLPALIEAFVQFLHGSNRLDDPNALIQMLKQARVDLPRLNSDPEQWGMTKTMMMNGLGAGFDMSTEEGIRQYVEYYSMRAAQKQFEAEQSEQSPPHKPFRREEAKVGRNDPCPCGSGKKYKKCCGK